MQNSSFQHLSIGSKSSFGQSLVNQSKTSFQSKSSRASRYRQNKEQPPVVDSCSSLKSTTSSYFQSALQKKNPRELTYEEQLQNMKAISSKVKKEADQVIRTANEIIDKTVNVQAQYHAADRVPPELVFLDHARFLNGRILRAEEAKIKMECTPELVDGLNRRYLPQTVGRRNQIVDADIQDVHLQREYTECFDAARDTLRRRQEELQSQLDVVYATQMNGIRPGGREIK